MIYFPKAKVWHKCSSLEFESKGVLLIRSRRIICGETDCLVLDMVSSKEGQRGTARSRLGSFGGWPRLLLNIAASICAERWC